MSEKYICKTPEETFELGEKLGESLKGGEVILLYGDLGAGKTVFTKGLLAGLGYDADEVTSPSFALVNLYRAKFDVYHIDLWRLDESANPAADVGLDEIRENKLAIAIIEWAEKLGNYPFFGNIYKIDIKGDGDDPRSVTISSTKHRAF